MNNSNTILSKHIWSKDETTLVTRAYLEGKTVEEAHLLVPNIKLSSLKMKYANCLYLDKGPVRLALKNYSKIHKDIWDELKPALTVPDVDEEASEYDAWCVKIPEEDGEIYFKCTGICNKVLHYEDTDGEGMCGTCQFNLSKDKTKNIRK